MIMMMVELQPGEYIAEPGEYIASLVLSMRLKSRWWNSRNTRRLFVTLPVAVRGVPVRAAAVTVRECSALPPCDHLALQSTGVPA